MKLKLQFLPEIIATILQKEAKDDSLSHPSLFHTSPGPKEGASHFQESLSWQLVGISFLPFFLHRPLWTADPSWHSPGQRKGSGPPSPWTARGASTVGGWGLGVGEQVRKGPSSSVSLSTPWQTGGLSVVIFYLYYYSHHFELKKKTHNRQRKDTVL